VAQKAGLDAGPVNEDEIDDGMSEKQILPVYPHIALRLGVPGGLLFKKRMVWGKRETYTLLQYIRKTYQLYRKGPREGFDDEDIQRAAGILRNYL
jgi:hypothetical protein